MDIILHPYHDYTRTYIDNFIIFLDTLNNHISHLDAVLQDVLKYNITIALDKTFLSFPTVKLLDQYVDVFSLITYKKKLKVITKICFLTNFYELDM